MYNSWILRRRYVSFILAEYCQNCKIYSVSAIQLPYITCLLYYYLQLHHFDAGIAHSSISLTDMRYAVCGMRHEYDSHSLRRCFNYHEQHNAYLSSSRSLYSSHTHRLWNVAFNVLYYQFNSHHAGQLVLIGNLYIRVANYNRVYNQIDCGRRATHPCSTITYGYTKANASKLT